MYIYERVPFIPLSPQRPPPPPLPPPREVPLPPFSLFILSVEVEPPIEKDTSHVDPPSNVIISPFCSFVQCQYPCS
jgi:hypothetical protein